MGPLPTARAYTPHTNAAFVYTNAPGACAVQADVDASDGVGNTPLHLAADNTCPSMIKLLLVAGTAAIAPWLACL